MPITSISRSPSTLSAAGPRKGAGAPSAAEDDDDEDEDELPLLDGSLLPPDAAAGGSSSAPSVEGLHFFGPAHYSYRRKDG